MRLIATFMIALASATAVQATAQGDITAPLRASQGITQEQQDRLNEVGKFVVISPLCQRLGMTVDPEIATKAEAALQAETASWKSEVAVVERLKGEAISRQGRILKTDLDAVVRAATTDAQLRKVSDVLGGYGQTCVAAAADSIFSSLIVLPKGYDVHAAATDAADKMLEAGGLASWQTPQIQARGDLMMLAGACRSKIGSTRSDALVKEFSNSDDARVREYYFKSFDTGLGDPSILSSVAACDKAISSLRSKAK